MILICQQVAISQYNTDSNRPLLVSL